MIRYRILPEHKLVVLCFYGSTDEQEILQLSAQLQSDPDFSLGCDALVDNTYLEHTVSGQELRDLAEPRLPRMDPNTRLAVIAPADVTYGVSRMHQMLSEYRIERTVEVFRDRESALRWLGKGDLALGSLCEELAGEGPDATS